MGNQDGVKSSLVFHDYLINYVDFKINKNFKEEPINISFHITRHVNYDKSNENIAFVTVNVKVFEHAEENNYPFSLNMSIEGEFEVLAEDEEQKYHFTHKNAVAILFPYVRSLISTYTANANVPPLILPPINVLKMIDD